MKLRRRPGSALLARFARDRRGGVAMLFGFAMPAMLGLGGAALDYSNASSQRTKLQGIADAAALAAAREFRLGNATTSTVTQVADNFAKAALAGAKTEAQVASSADTTKKSITVKISADIPTYIMQFAGAEATKVSAQATAKVVGGAPICVIGLDQKAGSTVELEKSAKLEAPGCAVYSNSTGSQGLKAKDSASVRAAFICTAGGKMQSGNASFSPYPQLDCPPLPDPLAARPMPSIGGCIASKLVVDGAMMNLTPGTYCGGVTIKNNAKVTMSPGTYVFKDGGLTVTGNGSLSGNGVGLVFSGFGARLKLDTESNVSLSAPKSGEMAGLLIFEDRASPEHQKHQIISNNARTLLGTIYLPRGRLHVAANKPVADQSAYTIVVARMFSLSEGPTMVLNSNYSGTDVPVPEGVGPSGMKPMLTQ